jgi:hypothetical protein
MRADDRRGNMRMHPVWMPGEVLRLEDADA